MAITEIYVDPSIAADSGAGTIGDPYGDLEYAIEQTTFDTTNGTRVNIKAGTQEVVAVANAVSVAMADTGTSVAWAPSATAKAVFRGYTAAAGDGGIGVISGAGSHGVFFNHSYTDIVDLHVHNCGANTPIRVATKSTVINCEVSNTTGRGIHMTASGLVMGCYVHDIGGSAIDIIGNAISNLITNTGTKTCARAINVGGASQLIMNNIIDVDSTSDGIYAPQDKTWIIGNSIYSNGGSGSGIWVDDTNCSQYIVNNLIEGFSATGGHGIELTGTGLAMLAYGGNSIYNCETIAEEPAVLPYYDFGLATPNETLSVSPFTNAASGDFSPVDTGAVKEGAEPQTFPAE